MLVAAVNRGFLAWRLFRGGQEIQATASILEAMHAAVIGCVRTPVFYGDW